MKIEIHLKNGDEEIIEKIVISELDKVKPVAVVTTKGKRIKVLEGGRRTDYNRLKTEEVIYFSLEN